MYNIDQTYNITELDLIKNITQFAHDEICPVQGNPDLYGLGIRIGIYIQMISVQLSETASQLLDSDNTLGQAIVIFVLAVATVLWRLIKQVSVQPVEVFPMLTLLIAQLGVCRLPWRRGQTSTLVRLVYLAESIGLNALFIWFWWKGMDTLPRGCETDYAFFFSKVPIWGWFRKFNMATSVIFGILGFTAAALSLVVFAAYMFNNLLSLRSGTHGYEQNATRDSNPFAGFQVLVIVGMVVYVELALRWNNISGVHSLNSPGQFMPLFISLAQLCATLWQLMKGGVQRFGDVPDMGRPNDPHEDLPCGHGKDDYDDIPLGHRRIVHPENGVAPSPPAAILPKTAVTTTDENRTSRPLSSIFTSDSSNH